MSSSVTIRSAAVADMPAVARFAAQLVRLHHAFDAQRFFCQEPIEPGYERWLTGELTNRDAVVMVAEQQGGASSPELLGYAYGRLEPRDWNSLLDACGALHDVFVAESARGLGAGAALVEAVVARLRELGAERVVLNAAVHNTAARRLFERLGFRFTMHEMTRELTATTARRGRIEQINRENRARAQLHRWWAFHESPRPNIQHQYELLSRDFLLKTAAGDSRGREAYEKRIAALPPGLRRGHQLQEITARAEGDGVVHLQAKLIHQAVSRAAGLSSRAVTYHGRLSTGAALLPVFEELRIEMGPEVDMPYAVDTYAYNRAMATLYTWIAHLESPDVGPQGLRDLIATDALAIQLGEKAAPITNYDELAAWFATTAAAFSHSGHWIQRPRVAEITPGRYRLQTQFAWEGITKSGKEMVAKTKHTWELVDTGDRFARIEQLAAVAVEPFREVAG